MVKISDNNTSKAKTFYISLYLIIPFILAGVAVLFALSAHYLTNYLIEHHLGIGWPVTILLVVCFGVTFVLGFFVVWLLFYPVQTFLKNAEALPVFSERSEPNSGIKDGQTGDELKRVERLFQQVTDVLSKVDAKQFFPEMIGDSLAIRAVFSQIKKVAPTDSTVLVFGESGTGKELIAASIHQHSKRKEMPFAKINCVAIPEELLESELFGHEKGAFTGAVSKKIGKFESANGGTVFLDEIGDMPLRLQAKMLRVLQEKEFDRIGGLTTIKVDIRFVAATNKDLAAMVKAGTFREDLYYRLNAFPVHVPPLRKRREDIPLLVNHFLDHDGSGRRRKISAAALAALCDYHWPGNVRDLKNIIERAEVLSDGDMIDLDHLPPEVAGSSAALIAGSEVSSESNFVLDAKMQEIEKNLILDALQQTGGVQVKAANILGIKERSLWNRIKKYDIDVSAIKSQAKQDDSGL